MSTSKQRGPGRPKGSKNTEIKEPGKQISIWLPGECAARAERLKRKESYGALICRALVALENAEEPNP